MSILTAIRQTSKGAVVIADWLGSGGKPVSLETAEQRSLSCISGNNGLACPHNTSPRWWEKAKGSIASAIHDMLAVKNECAMAVANEDRLHMCRQCGCCLPLKVWTPIDHVRRILDKDTVSKLPTYCWMKKEIAQP